jgi:tetratricopeptide (TPR) repeat protein
MGMIRAGKNQFELAEQELQTALRLDPYSADAYRELAGVYESTRREADAEATFRKAIELRKDDWWSVKQLGVFYFRKGRYAEAEKVFWEVIRLTPDSAKAYSNLGGALLAMGRTAEAAVQLERSVSIEPNARGYSNLGAFYFYEGRFADAVAPFEKASAMVPTDSKFLLHLADAYRWTPALAAKAPPTYRRALELIEKEIAVAPLDAQLLARRATARSSLGEHRGAISDIEAALRLPAADGFVHFRASLVYEEAQRRDAALREVDAALRAHYRLHEILHAPELAALMKDPRFQAIVEARKEK